MTELKKIAKEIGEKMGIAFSFYPENARPASGPVCMQQFETVTDDGTYTYFRFLFKNVGYIGVVEGTGTAETNYALLLPAYIEGFMEQGVELTKAEMLRRILLGESSSMLLYKYATKYSVRALSAVVIVLRIPKLMEESIVLLEQYGGNSLDTVVKISDDTCAFVKYSDRENDDYRSTVDYAEFLIQLLKEELGLDVEAGVGPTVREFKDVSVSYSAADNALRYADVFGAQGKVHSYREFILIRMLEDFPESKLISYLSELTDENSKEIFEDEEMLVTAETFLQNSLNVSETSRNLYMHRNTLLYRLDKIEKATGFNLRSFSDAVSFRVLTLLYKLIGK
ncbi:MAG: helix-turn-helix domain-containing protein [Clostridia bacterium]|nr:helix-turn-helix domain-containing protein [Clostridia bacterium]